LRGPPPPYVFCKSVISLEFLLVFVKEYDSEEVSRLLPMVKSCGQEERGRSHSAQTSADNEARQNTRI